MLQNGTHDAHVLSGTGMLPCVHVAVEGILGLCTVVSWLRVLGLWRGGLLEGNLKLGQVGR